ncbi:MAG TPA: hypothetical protein VGV86_12330 [Acidimicrobiales bacterium]|nr:hypothetical protein [Acidimicrobiales bacterium]
MPTDVNPQLGEQGPQPSARALVLAVVLMQGGQAEVEDVMIGLDNPHDAGWNDDVRAELLQLAGAGVLAVDGDRVTLTLNEEGWRRLAATLAAAVVELTDGSGRSVTHVLAQAVDQVPTGSGYVEPQPSSPGLERSTES